MSNHSASSAKSDRVEIIDLTLSDQEEESRTDSAASVAPEAPSKVSRFDPNYESYTCKISD